nr:PQQ-binding-like beta-propeller repeat protein [Pirellulaceae bacterium]
PQELKPPYRAVWVHAARHKPRPAWPEPVWEPQRIDFDYAYAISAQSDMVYYASSADHALHALDLASGKEKWVFFTEAPVRLAPEFHAGHVLFTSDDGFLYCLKQSDGSLVWKYRPEGMPDERLIGNEQMISRWAARSGVLVEGNRVYTTFGMLAPEGVAVCCLDAASGNPIWINDTCGYHFMARPHSTAMGGVSPQGYLAVTDRLLVVACGRSTPALFDKQTGRLLYHEADGDFTGGGSVMTASELIFTQADTLKKEYGAELRRADESPESEIFDLATLVALDGATGREVFSLRGGSRGTLSDDGLFTLIGRKQLMAVGLDDVRRATPAQATVIQHTLGHFVESGKIRRWSAPVERVYSLLQAGQTVIAGGRGTVECFDAADGKSLWHGQVAGQIRALCVAADRLIASSSEGEITCFAPAGSASSQGETPAPERPAEPLPPPSGGYCLVTGDCELHRLIDLARSFDLVIYAMTARDPAPLRQRLYEAGLYGTRIVVHRIDGPTLPYTDYFANEVRCAEGDLPAGFGPRDLFDADRCRSSKRRDPRRGRWAPNHPQNATRCRPVDASVR